MSHLGDAVYRLVDDELDGLELAQAFAHLAICPRCMTDVEEARGLRARLALAPVPAPSQGFFESLASLSSQPSAFASPTLAFPPRPAAARPAAARPDAARPAAARLAASRSRVRVGSVAAAGLAASVMVGLAGGGPAGPGGTSGGGETPAHARPASSSGGNSTITGVPGTTAVLVRRTQIDGSRFARPAVAHDVSGLLGGVR